MYSARFVFVAMIASCGLLAAAPLEKATNAKVTGLITFRGKPVLGKISLYQDNGQFVGCKIDNDGRYKIDHAPLGKQKVTIEGEGIPAQYAFDDKTPLVVQVNDDKNEFNFELK